MGKFNNFLRQNQQSIGKGLSALSGSVSLFSQFDSMANEARGIRTDAPAQTTDYYGRPEYNLNEATQNAVSIDPQGASGGEVLSGVAQGASAGAAFGPVGAGIGAAVGAIGSLFAGGARKREMEEKKRKAINSLRFAQMQYGKAQDQFNIQNSGMNMYNKLNDMSQRENNLYTFNNPYQQ